MPDSLSQRYRPSLGLLTDLYQLTMAYGYWKNRIAEREAVFHLFFRKAPFKGSYAIAAGLEDAIHLMQGLHFPTEDLEYLATLTGNDGKPLFEHAFLDYLAQMRFSCDVDAIPEGSLAFPHEPLLRIRGPLAQGQLLETPLLTVINFQTLIATKAARVVEAAQGDSVLEFGLRRAQGIDGGLSASRAAHIGGCDATSNVLAGRLFGIPVRGTHAHAWVMSFGTELEAFQAYAAAMPNNCVFLVDTYDTLEGTRHAVQVGQQLRAQGHELAGIRLDSGDLHTLSVEARKILDAGGFPNARIVASNDLDEYTMADLKAKGARIDTWGVGTKLATAYDQPALGGVYKLGAIRDDHGNWDYKVKLSEQLIKVSNPGLLNVRRFYQHGHPVGDMLFNEEAGADLSALMDPMEAHKAQPMPDYDSFADLLVPVFRNGKLLYDPPSLAEIRSLSLQHRSALAPAIRANTGAAPYPLGLDRNLHDLKVSIISRIQNA